MFQSVQQQALKILVIFGFSLTIMPSIFFMVKLFQLTMNRVTFSWIPTFPATPGVVYGVQVFRSCNMSGQRREVTASSTTPSCQELSPTCAWLPTLGIGSVTKEECF